MAEQKELSKDQYIEVQQIIDGVSEKIIANMKENFVCVKHCTERHAKIDIKFDRITAGVIVIAILGGVFKYVGWI